MMKTSSVIIRPVVTEASPALPTDIAVTVVSSRRLRCPAELTNERRSPVSRRINAIAALRSRVAERRLQATSLSLPPQPLQAQAPPLQKRLSSRHSSVVECPGGRQLHWPSAHCHSDRVSASASAVAVKHKSRSATTTSKRVEPVPQLYDMHTGVMTVSDNWEVGELPRLRLQHQNSSRSGTDGVWTNLQLECLPICRSVPRLTSVLGTSVNLPPRPNESGESRNSLPGVRTTSTSLASSTDVAPTPVRSPFREKRELLSPAIVAPSPVKDCAKDPPGRRHPPVLIEPVAPQRAVQATPATSATPPTPPSPPPEVNEPSNEENLSEEAKTPSDEATKATPVSDTTGQDLIDGVLVCTPISGPKSAAPSLETPSISRSTTSNFSRRTRPFSVVSSPSSKPTKYSIVTDGASEYPDPFTGAAPPFLQRLMDLSMQESDTIRWERMRSVRRKPRFLNRQD